MSAIVERVTARANAAGLPITSQAVTLIARFLREDREQRFGATHPTRHRIVSPNEARTVSTDRRTVSMTDEIGCCGEPA